MPRRAQPHPLEGKANIRSQRRNQRGHIGPHKKRSNQHGIFTHASRSSCDEVGKAGFVGTQALAMDRMAHQRTATVPGAQRAQILERFARFASLIRTQT